MTKLLYLSNTFTFTGQGTVLEVKEIPNAQPDRSIAVILDQTIFYAQGGGQPADTGRIYTKDTEFKVNHVIHDSGTVLHLGEFTSGSLLQGLVSLEINDEKRILNASLHTAGHLLASLVECHTDLIGKKGYHFIEGPYVEFQGVSDELTKEVIEHWLKEAIDKSLAVSAVENEGHRIVSIGDYQGTGCGGTHLNNVKGLRIAIRKISSKKGLTTIRYKLE
jgi:Ser-tRNA(Ala) deacylase AlaX